MTYHNSENLELIKQLEIKQNKLDHEVGKIRETVGILRELLDVERQDVTLDGSPKYDEATGKRVMITEPAFDRHTNLTMEEVRKTKIYEYRKIIADSLLV